MRIIGIGTDIVDIKRIERAHNRYGKSFLEKILTASEIELAGNRINDPAYVAKRWAGKESCIKALGGKISFLQAEILKNKSGQPILKLLGEFASYTGFITLSDEYPYAQAYVIIVSQQ